MNRATTFVTLLTSIFITTAALAQVPSPVVVKNSGEFAQAQSYWQLQENTQDLMSSGFQSPRQMAIQGLSRALENDLDQNLPRYYVWKKVNRRPELPPINFNRKKHFGKWIKDPTGSSCMNVSDLILKRDSKTAIQTVPADICEVASGTWEDPYSGQIFTESKDMNIDHMVPLKHAYLSGAWKWPAEKRCYYANYMENDFHLLTVSARENMVKADKGPDKYLPPNSASICNYLKQWNQVKLTWGLIFLPAEVDAIQKMAQKGGCDAKDLAIDRRQVLKDRSLIEAGLPACKKPAKNLIQ